MAVISVGSFLQGAAHPAQTDRRWLRSLFGARGGVVPQTATFTDLKVTQRGAGANMSVDVAEGSVMVTGTEATYQGLYHGDNQGVTNVVISAADGTNPRRTMIVARIKDTEYGVAVTDAFSLETVDGTPAGAPADPTIPANCVVLARVAVAAAASSITNANITDLRNGYAAVTGSAVIGNQQKATALGGVVPCLSTFRPTVGLYAGLVAWETDTKRLIVYNGTAWEGVATSASAETLTSETTTSTTYVDLATVGPAVTMATGAKVRVFVNARIATSALDGYGLMGVTISGASSLAASDAQSLAYQSYTASASFHLGAGMLLFSGLTPGLNTFTAKYKNTGGGISTFQYRRISVESTL